MDRREYIDSAYYEGRSGRQDHTSKYACPFGYLTRKWAWWTAGWNDMDMELQLEAQEQSAATAAHDGSCPRKWCNSSRLEPLSLPFS